MTWLVFGVSCVLVLAGAVSIISGAPIIQLERGWAEVIAGTVALSSGGVVFALAGILMRLESIRDTMAATAVPLSAERVVAAAAAEGPKPVEPLPPVPLPVEADEAPAPVAAEIAAPAEPPPASTPLTTPDEETTQGLWKRVKRPVIESGDASLQSGGFPDRPVPDPDPRSESRPAPTVIVPSHTVAEPPPEPARPAIETTSDGDAAKTEPSQIGWLERSLFKTRSTRPMEPLLDRAEPSIKPMASISGSSADAPIEPSLTIHAPVPEPLRSEPPSSPPIPEPSAAAEPAPTPDLASEHHEGVTVIGRYQAGVASYVMYSDGTIEVETEGGDVHRFGSMEELKAYIAQQESPVA